MAKTYSISTFDSFGEVKIGRRALLKKLGSGDVLMCDVFNPDKELYEDYVKAFHKLYIVPNEFKTPKMIEKMIKYYNKVLKNKNAQSMLVTTNMIQSFHSIPGKLLTHELVGLAGENLNIYFTPKQINDMPHNQMMVAAIFYPHVVDMVSIKDLSPNEQLKLIGAKISSGEKILEFTPSVRIKYIGRHPRDVEKLPKDMFSTKEKIMKYYQEMKNYYLSVCPDWSREKCNAWQVDVDHAIGIMNIKKAQTLRFAQGDVTTKKDEGENRTKN